MGRESATEGWKDLAVCQETMPFNRICFLTSDGPAEANGRLIAAAPDLLALAKQYASECAECDGTGREPYTDEFRECEECRDIRLVIAKAEGR